jgi:hypothetical protein
MSDDSVIFAMSQPLVFDDEPPIPPELEAKLKERKGPVIVIADWLFPHERAQLKPKKQRRKKALSRTVTRVYEHGDDYLITIE